MSEELFKDAPQPTGPRISESGLSYYKSLLENTRWVEENPSQAAMLKSSVESAIALTGQNLEPPADNRTLAQQAHDRLFGVSFTPQGTPKLPSTLANLIERDAATPSDAKSVAAQLKGLGRDPEKALGEAQALLEKIGSQVKATALSAASVLQLGVYAEHLKKHAAKRPQ